jgi:parallel beta-helix repeat protein
MRSTILLLILLTLTSSGLGQQTIQVPSGAPTIQAGIDAATNGDTVLVSPGTYNENIDFKGKAITVTSGAKSFADAASTVINGTNDGPVVVFATNEPAAAILNGFTVQNGHASLASGLNGGGISISNASPTVTNNVVSNNTGCGILVFNSASSLIQGNDIKQNHGTDNTFGSLCEASSSTGGAPSGTGLAILNAGYVQVVGNTIEDNVLDETPTNSLCFAGVDVQGGTKVLLEDNIIRNNHSDCTPGFGEAIGSPASELVLIQNLFYGNRSDDGTAATEQVFVSGRIQAPYPSVTEINNTIYGPGQELVLSFGPSTFDNNIFFNTNTDPEGQVPAILAGLWCADSQSQTSPLAIGHNDIFNAGTLQSGDCPLGDGNLSVDPLFVNPANSDFHTQPTSPVVATGDINAPFIPSADLDGKARTVCNTIDMGAYEVHPHPSIVLAGSPNPTPGRSTVTFTATLKGNCNTPTGTVTFLDGSTVLGTAPLNGTAIATFMTSFLFVGSHSITATYPGDFNFDDATSNIVTEVITGPPTTTVLNSVSPNPAHSLEPITMTATVTSAYTTPTGNVTFMAGGTSLATVPVSSSGAAVATVSTLIGGTYTITAVYGGSTEYAGSTSNAVVETVLGSETSTSLNASPNPATPGQSITFTAIVSGAQSAGPLAGTVTFKDGATTLGTGSVGTNGVATLSISSLLTGTHLITAAYGGSPEYNPSASGAISVVVTAIPTSVDLSASPNPAAAGQSVSLVATAASVIPGQVPMGVVTFSDQYRVLGTAPLAAGVAAFSTTSLFAGTHTITATLSPGGFFGASTSAPVTEVVTDYNFALLISPTSLTIPSGDYQALGISIIPSGGFSHAVNLECSSLPAHAQCSFNPATNKAQLDAYTVKLTINTSAVFEYGQQVGGLILPSSRRSRVPAVAGVLFPLMALCGLAGGVSRRLNARLRRLLLVLAVAGLSLSFEACSGKLPGKTPPGNYIVTVTATDADPTSPIVHTVNLQLEVTP